MLSHQLIIFVIILIVQTTKALNICKGIDDGVLNENYNNCSTYFKCEDQTPILFSCPDNLLFDYHNQKCNYPKCVKCFECPNVAFIDVPVTSNCNHFIRCYKNQPTPMECPDGLHFDSETGMCNYESNSICRRDTECPLCGLHFKRVKNDGNKYFVCVDGNKIEQQCPSDLKFDTNKLLCGIEKCGSKTQLVHSYEVFHNKEEDNNDYEQE